MTGVNAIKANLINFGSTESIKALNRRLHWGKRGTVYQHDPGHVHVLCERPRTRATQLPAKHDVTDEEPEPWDQVQHNKYWSQVARCLFLRADITFIVNELWQRMSNSTQRSLAKLQRLVRYLKRERQWVQIFSYGRMVEELTTSPDSVWTGCKETRKSSSAGVILPGSHTLQAYTRKLKIIARGRAEAELYAAALGASESKGIDSLLKDLRCEMKPVLAIDAKATKYIFHRQGVGGLKHFDVA